MQECFQLHCPRTISQYSALIPRLASRPDPKRDETLVRQHQCHRLNAVSSSLLCTSLPPKDASNILLLRALFHKGSRCLREEDALSQHG
jgi:hypothetical protein